MAALLLRCFSIILSALFICCGIVLLGFIATELDAWFIPYQDYHVQQEVVHIGYTLPFYQDEEDTYLSIIDEDEPNYWSCPNCSHLNGEMVSQCGSCGCSKYL